MMQDQFRQHHSLGASGLLSSLYLGTLSFQLSLMILCNSIGRLLGHCCLRSRNQLDRIVYIFHAVYPDGSTATFSGLVRLDPPRPPT